MKTQRGKQSYSFTLSLTPTPDGVCGQLHAPAALHLGKSPGTNFTGGWVGPREGLDGCGKSRPHQNSMDGPCSPKQVAVLTELSLSTSPQKVPKFCDLKAHDSNPGNREYFRLLASS